LNILGVYFIVNGYVLYGGKSPLILVLLRLTAASSYSFTIPWNPSQNAFSNRQGLSSRYSTF
jgi:hypothetical protein